MRRPPPPPPLRQGVWGPLNAARNLPRADAHCLDPGLFSQEPTGDSSRVVPGETQAVSATPAARRSKEAVPSGAASLSMEAAQSAESIAKITRAKGKCALRAPAPPARLTFLLRRRIPRSWQSGAL